MVRACSVGIVFIVSAGQNLTGDRLEIWRAVSYHMTDSFLLQNRSPASAGVGYDFDHRFHHCYEKTGWRRCTGKVYKAPVFQRKWLKAQQTKPRKSRTSLVRMRSAVRICPAAPEKSLKRKFQGLFLCLWGKIIGHIFAWPQMHHCWEFFQSLPEDFSVEHNNLICYVRHSGNARELMDYGNKRKIFQLWFEIYFE